MASLSARVLESSANLNSIVSMFPQTFSFAFAYGSGIFKQIGNSKKSMIDFIFAVDDPQKWHSENLKLNKRHYSLMRLGGPGFINKLQQELGAGIYFNTLVPHQNKVIKYGVISTSKLILDLLDWETLYVSGRLHKPTLVLRDAHSVDLKSALKVNLQSALHAVLLRLPETFTEKELYLYLAGLSYLGDFRMMIGEDQNKVPNIVEAQMGDFRQLYAPHMRSMNHVLHWDEARQILEQDCSPSARLHHLTFLPKQLQQHLVKAWNRDGRYQDQEDVLKASACDVDCADIITQGIETIVNKSSWSQSVKGILTAGLWKSTRYGGAKLFKLIRSVKRNSRR